MFGLICVVIIIAIVASIWFLGLWNNFITLINLTLSALVASSFFEPLADLLDRASPTYTYFWDFVSLWLLFFVTFLLLRVATDVLSRYKLTFNIWVDMIGRTVVSFVTAWIFLCFALFTLHTAPLPPGAGGFQASPQTRNFTGSPDRLWLAFLQSRSRGALSDSISAPLLEKYDTRQLHPDDQDLNCRVFDSKSDFIYKYNYRRETLLPQSALRVQR